MKTSNISVIINKLYPLIITYPKRLSNKSLILGILTTFAVLYAGCRVMITNFDEDEIIQISTNPEVHSFAITDSYQQTSYDFDQPAHINGGISGGEFDISYSVSNEPYYVYLTLNNQNISGGGITFYNGICGYSSCSVDITCRFTNAIKISCGNIGIGYPSNPEVDVSPLVTAIPMGAYIILRACNSEHSICVEQYQAIELQ